MMPLSLYVLQSSATYHLQISSLDHAVVFFKKKSNKNQRCQLSYFVMMTFCPFDSP
jgi:hypothetical protein